MEPVLWTVPPAGRPGTGVLVPLALGLGSSYPTGGAKSTSRSVSSTLMAPLAAAVGFVSRTDME